MLRRWILVADAGCAKFLSPQKDGELAHLFPTLHPEEVPEIQGRDKGEHKPCIAKSSSAKGYPHCCEPHTDWHKVEKTLFCSVLAKTLNHHEKDFDVLTLVAPPLLLGELRHKLDAGVLQKVDKEIDKDLTKTPLTEIKDYIGPSPLFTSSVKKD